MVWWFFRGYKSRISERNGLSLGIEMNKLSSIYSLREVQRGHIHQWEHGSKVISLFYRIPVSRYLCKLVVVSPQSECVNVSTKTTRSTKRSTKIKFLIFLSQSMQNLCLIWKNLYLCIFINISLIKKKDCMYHLKTVFTVLYFKVNLRKSWS